MLETNSRPIFTQFVKLLLSFKIPIPPRHLRITETMPAPSTAVKKTCFLVWKFGLVHINLLLSQTHFADLKH